MSPCVRILPHSMSTAPGADTSLHFRHSYTKDRRELLNRLRRIEGQARGLQRLVEEEAYCLDLLQQVEALTAAADQVGLLLLEDHISGCLTHAIEIGPGAALRGRGDDGGAPHHGPAGQPAQELEIGLNRGLTGTKAGVPQGGTTALPALSIRCRSRVADRLLAE